MALSALVTAVPAQAASDIVIRRTEYGIPHIKAKDFKGIGYGYGYALAQDQVCLMADTYPFDTPFDADDPVKTPRGLATDNPEVRTALADAVEELNDSGIALNSALGSWQYDIRGDTKIPIHGGPGDPIGQFNAIFAGFERGEKEADVDFGSSFVMVASLTGNRCPDVRTILTYSQSSNPSSPHYMDQTKLFSKKRWVKERFCERAVRRATKSTVRLRVR